MDDVKYFRIECSVGKEYFAAISETHVRALLGSLDDVYSLARSMGGKLETLVEISFDEASGVHNFPLFKASVEFTGGLITDGTFMLGSDSCMDACPMHQYSSPSYNQRN